jgi:hypothetical protein
VRSRRHPRLYLRPRDTVLLTTFAVFLLLITAVAFDGLLELISGILIGLAFLTAGRLAAIRGGRLRSENKGVERRVRRSRFERLIGR